MICVGDNTTIRDIFINELLILVFNNDNHGIKMGIFYYDNFKCYCLFYFKVTSQLQFDLINKSKG